jgi:hypothetical protein
MRPILRRRSEEFIKKKLPGLLESNLQRHSRKGDHRQGRRAGLPKAIHHPNVSGQAEFTSLVEAAL